MSSGSLFGSKPYKGFFLISVAVLSKVLVCYGINNETTEGKSEDSDNANIPFIYNLLPQNKTAIETTRNASDIPTPSPTDEIDRFLANREDQPIDRLDEFITLIRNSSHNMTLLPRFKGYGTRLPLRTKEGGGLYNKTLFYAGCKGLRLGNFLVMKEYIKREKLHKKASETQLPILFFTGIVCLMSACVLLVGCCMACFCDGGNTTRKPFLRPSPSARSSTASIQGHIESLYKQDGEVIEV